MTLGKSLDLFVSLCLHVLNRADSIGYLKELLKRLSKLIYVGLHPGELPVNGRLGETDEEAHCSSLAGGRFNKLGNLYEELVLGGCKISRSSHPSAGVLKVCVKA